MNTLLRNQRGMITLDTIFGLGLTLGAMLVVFAMAFTLSMVEVVQYVAFSTSRAYYAAHLNPEKQRELAEAKYNSLISKGAVKNVFRSSWFDIQLVDIGNFSENYEDVTDGSTTSNPLWGVEIIVNAKLLNFNIPFFGRTSQSSDAFKTKVTSYIGREVTEQECAEFFKERYEAILALPTLTGNGYSELSSTANRYRPIMDNGC